MSDDEKGWNKIPDVKLTPASGTNQYTGTYNSNTGKLEYAEKSMQGGQALAKDYWEQAKDAYGTRHFISIGVDYNSIAQYNGIFEFAKAMHEYYANSTEKDRAQVYQPWLKDNKGEIVNLSRDDMLTINTHVIELLNETFKKEVNKNAYLTEQNTKQKNELIKYKDSNVVLTLENKLLKQGSIVNKESILEKDNIVLKNKLAVYEEDIVNLRRQLEMFSNKRKKIIDEAEKNRKDKKYQQETIKISLLMLGAIVLYGIINYL